MLEHITPVILTYNEAPNIARTLKHLAWARDIVVVDSYSDDETLSLVSKLPQARVFQRKFDNHANQANFALRQTGLTSDWVLALDADFICQPQLIEELRRLNPARGVAGYIAKLVYCIHGKPLRGSALPSLTVLFRRAGASFTQNGHAHRVKVAGDVKMLNAAILHDDRKSLAHWLRSQQRYMALEAEKLTAAGKNDLDAADRLRQMRVAAPFVMFVYCLFVKGAILDGRAGLYYAAQRMLAELILTAYLLEHDMQRPAVPKP